MNVTCPFVDDTKYEAMKLWTHLIPILLNSISFFYLIVIGTWA